MLFLYRVVVGFLLMAGVFLLGLGLCLIRPFSSKNLFTISQMIAWIAQKIFGIEFVMEGQENLDQAPAIILSNHQNNFDMFPGAYTCPRRCVILGKKQLIWIPLFGLFYWLSGNIMIDRENKKRAWDSLHKALVRLKTDNLSLWVLPEGTRSRGKGLLPFKKGAFTMAITGELPVIPVCFSSYHKYFDFSKSKSGTIRVSVLKPIETSKLKIEDEPKLREQCFQLMKNEISRLDDLNQSRIS